MLDGLKNGINLNFPRARSPQSVGRVPSNGAAKLVDIAIEKPLNGTSDLAGLPATVLMELVQDNL
jgi:hypothetical protein